ncbi:hypothetical protein M8818_003155 [Zalaria obscura]|uniref:Uncharacterized protein n=1 Tax=Zalaria obscura TaxID=2024903 RepID=A0ACC3SH64_9PEZI
MAADILPPQVSIITPDLRAMHKSPDIDPDIAATLSDFLNFTEHLPSSLHRSLTLIAELDRKAVQLQQDIHDLTTIYARLNTPQATQDAPDPVQLRKEISEKMERIIKLRLMSAEESSRMEEMVNKDRNKLAIVTKKLKVMPMPPSRDPTPEAIPSSPQIRRNAQKAEAQAQADKRAAAHRTGTAPRVHSQKVMVPGEVLPPRNPDSPPPSEPSDWSSIRASSPVEPRQRQKSASARQKTPKPQKERVPKEKIPKTPRSRAPGMPGTNAHSAVAGISTSNALLALKPPPADAVNGSKWKPWTQLTEYEMATLRKSMKKNAIWVPSLAMKMRTLKRLGRGQSAKEQAKADAEANGTPFVDEYDISEWQDPTKVIISGEEKAEMNAFLGPELDAGDDEDALMNRGMRLNEAKKKKREKMLEDQAVQAQLDAEQGIKTEPSQSRQKTPKPAAPAAADTAQKKRKREATPPTTVPALDSGITDSPDVLSLSRPGPQPKKLKLNIPAQKVPLAPAGGSRPHSAGLLSPKSRPRSRRASAVPEAQNSASATAEKGRKLGPSITIKPSKAASAEPPNRRGVRRGSNASLPLGSPKTEGPAPGKRRSKRPAPGLLMADEDGSTKVSRAQRRAAPKKKMGKKDGKDGKEEEGKVENVVETEEFIDPDEPRYCICDNVSYGDMIACDNKDVSYAGLFSLTFVWFTGIQDTLLTIETVRERMVPSSLRQHHGVAATQDEMVLSRLQEEVEVGSGHQWPCAIVLCERVATFERTLVDQSGVFTVPHNTLPSPRVSGSGGSEYGWLESAVVVSNHETDLGCNTTTDAREGVP